MTGVDWEPLLDGLDVNAPAVAQIAEALAEATDTSAYRAYERVEAAIDAGILREVECGRSFPTVAGDRDGNPGPSNPVENEAEEPDTEGTNPEV